MSKTKANILGILFIIWSFSFTLGALSNIIVNEKLFTFNWANLTAIIFTVWVVFYIFIKPSKHHKEAIKNKNKLLVFICVLFAIPFFAKLSLERSLPLILHSLSNYPSKMIVTIENKSSGRKICRNKVELKGYHLFYNGKICNLNKKIYDSIKVNDTLTLIGNSSAFGFTMDGFKINTK